MAEGKLNIKSTTITNLAGKYGYSTPTFWGSFTEENLVDMIQLGWHPNKYALPPAVVRYIEDIIIGRKDRKTEFPMLKTLS